MRKYKCLQCNRIFIPEDSDAINCNDFCSHVCEDAAEAEEEEEKITLHPEAQRVANSHIKSEIGNLRQSLHIIKNNILVNDHDYNQACNLLETAIEKLEICLSYRTSRGGIMGHLRILPPADE